MKTLITCCILLMSQPIFGQTLIKGLVKDQKGNTIPGVNIFLKGTFEGTSSEIDGTYIIETGQRGDFTLVFQAMGYKSQEIEIHLDEAPIRKESHRPETHRYCHGSFCHGGHYRCISDLARHGQCGQI